ncbi:hypothetical protein D3C84_678320 [compost metagenome]
MRQRSAFHHGRIKQQPRMLALGQERILLAEPPRYFARDLGYFKRMRQARPVIIAGSGAEHLRFALQSAKSRGLDETGIVSFVFFSLFAERADRRFVQPHFAQVHRLRLLFRSVLRLMHGRFAVVRYSRCLFTLCYYS